jgi:SAM-dependent methyltransferase
LPTQKSLGHNKTKNCYRIGYWFWELSNFPKEWWHALDLVDEIWAPTRFIADTLLKISHKPVIHMPVPVEFTLQGKYSREHFSLPDDKFLFLFSYDFHSFSQRKNPEACINAFKQAFGTTDMRVGLVIKTVYAEKHQDAYERLLAQVQDDSRITIVNSILPRDEMYGLINVCDTFLSLHRSEGFGLGMAEAMLLGKPVIGTGYSGNMDFMNSENSCLVNFTLIPVERDAYPFWQGQEWAEPDVAHAAEYMRRIFENLDYRVHIAAKGKEYIQKHHSLNEVGRLMLTRLSNIDSRIQQPKPAPEGEIMNIPFPPIELMKSVGTTDESFFDNPDGELVFLDEVAPETYDRIFDFGCGCGRIARKLLLQKTYKPSQYVGIDLFEKSIRWCRENLTPIDRNYMFLHHDVFNAQFNPKCRTDKNSFPTTNKFTLVNAHSVFTHIVESQLEFYLSECARVLDDNGTLRTTWFLFDKSGFPMMQEFQNCLYINPDDLTNATIYDYTFIQQKFTEYGLVIYKIIPPTVRGFQWFLFAAKKETGILKAEFPDDVAPLGIMRLPVSIL